MELFAVPSLKGTVHTEVEETATILHHTVHIVAGKGLVRLVFSLEYTELIAVVAVEAVTGGDPQETVTVKVYLGHVTTGQLLVIGSKIFAHLSMDTQRDTKRK